MPALDWGVFTTLPGSPEKNFELLCRGIVRQNFGSCGRFQALANQPGVEFHLKLDRDCDPLGHAGRWLGWQCKWYDLPASGALGANRRGQIEDGLQKTERHVPGLTDWVLWTRRTLTKADQEWFYGLSSEMKLHLWTGDEVDNLLSGQAAVLRSTYFGELILTPEILRERNDQSIAPIRDRWQPDVHHVRDAERELRRMLGEAESWDILTNLSARLRASAQAVESSPKVPSRLVDYVTAVVTTSRDSADTLDAVAGGIGTGDLDLIRDELAARPRALPPDAVTAPRRLRAGNQRVSLYATNAVADCHDAIRAIGDIEAGFASGLVAVIAPAGCGKTHLAAQLTAGTTARPPGVLLHGRELHANHTLDDLARTLTLGTQPMPSMEALLAAVDAAGQRAQHRLPVLIDGLNESEDPRRWKPLLAALEPVLSKYPYVLLIFTLRPAFTSDAMPDGVRRVEIEDYGEDAIVVISKYFRHWKIDATDVSLPHFLRHPLTLRLFCEVTNPTRAQLVGMNAAPGSMTAVFDRYLKQVGVRVAELASRTHRFCASDVNIAIASIAIRMWETRTRSVELSELRDLLGDGHLPWDQSLLRALEQEGVLLRMPSGGSDTFVPAYDLLGGHIIANALLAERGASSFAEWVKEASTTSQLGFDYDVRHPLADDILQSLVEQVPRRFYAKQLWQLVEQPLRGRALRQAVLLEPAFLDAATVDAALGLVRAGDGAILWKLWQVRGTPDHPLNAEGLDRALREMTVGDRDLRWTEWIRDNVDEVLRRGRSLARDLQHLDERWRAGQLRTGDRLRARWVMWTLTSTLRLLRDHATRALYWFGRSDPEGLFGLTTDSLHVNDAYVSERMLAASYGVVMSHQQAPADFAVFLKPFLEQLASALAGPSASAPTEHYLTQLYVRGIVAFAAKYYEALLPPALSGTVTFAAPVSVEALAENDPRADEAEQTLNTDFVNYTLGSLFDDRGNYDMGHAGHRAAVAHVRGVVWALGWRAATFAALDRRIESNSYRGRREGRALAERYGKKYGWIGFYTYAGLLAERGALPLENHEFSDVDIDPSFPEGAPSDGTASLSLSWLKPSIESHETWMRAGTTSVPRSLLRRERIGGYDGPWVCAHAFVSAKDRVLGREAWAFISALVTPKECVPRLMAALRDGERPMVARDAPSDYYTFAGEIPWHPNFALEALDENAYSGSVATGDDEITVEILAHSYAWENHHSEMNRAGNTRVPSHDFSHRFELVSKPQCFDQFLGDGSRATITLSGVDGLEGDLLYIREDLIQQYMGNRDIVWSAFGERELRPYPASPPNWLVNAHQQGTNSWHEVYSSEDVFQVARPTTKKREAKRESEKRPAASAAKRATSKSEKKSKRKP